MPRIDATRIEATGPSRGRVGELDAWKRVFTYVRPHARFVASGAGLLLAHSAADLLKPWPLKWIIDSLHQSVAAPSTAATTLGTTALVSCAVILGTAVMGGLAEYYAQVCLAQAGHQSVASLRRDLFSHVQRLSMAFHRQSKAGDLLTRLVKDVSEIKNALTETALESFGEGVILVAMVVLLFAVDPMLAAIAALMFPCLLLCVTLHARRIREATRRQRDKESRSVSIFSETLAAMAVIQSFSREGHASQRFDRESRTSVTADLVATRLKARMNRWVEFIVAAGTCGVVFFGVGRVASGVITAGDLVVFTAYLRSMYKPVRRIASNTIQFSRATVGATRVAELLLREPEVRDLPGARPAPAFAGRLEFDRVGFAYTPQREILTEVSVAIEPGTVVAIIGCSGAGKSTLVSLVPRLHDPTEGCIRIDGHDIRDFTLDTLRAQISIVAQESVLLGMSVAANIAFGTPAATRERIEAAARAAVAHDFIARLPRAYDTVLGERGATLSGGERQRIALARAFCRDARILILDEPTTGLDAQSEAQLINSLQRLMVGKTTLIVAHRLSTIARADVVLHVDGGRVRRLKSSADLQALLATGARVGEGGCA